MKGRVIREQFDGPREDEGRGLSALQGDPLGDEFPDHERDVGDHDGDADEGKGGCPPCGESPGLQDRRERGRDLRGTEAGRDEARESDANLDSREETIRIAHE